MASPTEADIQGQIGKACKIFEEMRLFGHVSSPNLLQMEGDLVAAAEGDYSPELLAAWQSVRTGYAGLIDQAVTVLTPLLRTYGQFMGIPDTDPQAILTRLFERFTDESLTVETRAFTFGSPAADGGNTGTGTVNRLTTDANGQDIENQTADGKTCECISDEHSGASEHEELFLIRGETELRDRIQIAGSGLQGTLKAFSARDSQKLIQNPSFDHIDGSVGSLTSIPGWTPTSALSNFDLNTAYYRNPFGSSVTPYSLKIVGNDTLSQNFNVRRLTFNPNIPVYLQIAYDSQTGSCDGGLTLHLGGVTAQVADLSAAGAGWNILRIALDEDCWFENWNQEDPTIGIQLSGQSTGYVLIDDIVFYPMANFDGAWYSIVGSGTPFLRGDKFTWEDTETGAIIQRWLMRAYRRYLPHDASPTWADPGTITPTPTPTPTP